MQTTCHHQAVVPHPEMECTRSAFHMAPRRYPWALTASCPRGATPHQCKGLSHLGMRLSLLLIELDNGLVVSDVRAPLLLLFLLLILILPISFCHFVGVSKSMRIALSKQGGKAREKEKAEGETVLAGSPRCVIAERC